MRKLNLTAIILATVAVLGCATPASPPGLGESKATAIEVCKPQGQRAYLNQLQCSDGSTPTYRRVGNVGERNESPSNLTKSEQAALLNSQLEYTPLKPGEPDYHIVDRYEVSCSSVKRLIYMDMYHCNQALPTEAPVGFLISKQNQMTPIEAPPPPGSPRWNRLQPQPK